MKTLAGVLTGLALLTIPTLASAITITHYLSFGTRGAEVTALQEVLIKAGFLKVSATGYFGAMTRLAVMGFQKANGLETVGSVGPKTRALLNAATSPSAPAAPTPPTPSSPLPPMPEPQATTSQSSGQTTPPMPSPSPDAQPVVTLVSPAAVVSKSTLDVHFTVATDKPALCRYGTQPGMSLSNMQSFDDVVGTTHDKLLTSLSSGSLYIYYVRCEDTHARISNELQVSFSLTGQ